MNKIIIIFIAVIFMMISGCQKKSNAEKAVSQTNDIITDLIKEDILSTSTNTNVILNSNINITENIQATNQVSKVTNINQEIPKKQEVTKKLPVEPEVSVVNQKKTIAKEDKNIKDEGIKIPTKAKVKAKKAAVSKVVSKKEVHNGDSLIKVGKDLLYQSASPRSSIKITSVVFSDNKNARYVDFSIYALPKGKEINLDEEHLISYVRSIDIINGQAQFTKFWNGKNLNDEFLPQGNYNIYLVYSIKDEDKNNIKKESRFWGGSDKYYIKLY